MLSCGNKHPFLRQLMMFMFMIYLISSYILQFVIIGATFSSIVIFLVYVLNQLFLLSSVSILEDFANGNLVQQTLFATYLFLIFLTLFISLTLPVEKGIAYFRFVAVIFSLLTTIVVTGIIYFMTQTGFIMNELVFDPTTNAYEPNGITHFSWLTLAGVIMLSVYLVPIILRPGDFLTNASKYVVGFISYFLMMPMFLNVFTIYAMCNLHDVSWGNRPASTGTEAFT